MDDNSRWRCAKRTNFTIVKGVNVSTIGLAVGFCDNFTLRSLYPNLTCKTVAESQQILPFISFMLGHLEQYLDVADFAQPIKFNLKSYSFKLSMQYKFAEFSVGLNSALLQDSPLYTNYDEKNVSYVSVKLN